jgi:hypothetical protein
VADAQTLAEEQLDPLAPQDCVLVYDGVGHEFVELSPDGLRVLDAIERAGNVDSLLRNLESSAPAARARLTDFIAQLHRQGLVTTAEPAPLLPSTPTQAPQPTSL